VKDGLVQSNVTGVVQDSAGFYWIATGGGVSRFDGQNFINYTTEFGLTDNNVSAIFIDKHQHLWLGHQNGTLTKYDGKLFTEIKSRLLPKDKKIYSFFQERNGCLWVCTETAGAICIINPDSDKGGYQTRVYSGKDGLSQYVLSATQDNTGNLWFLTDIGIKIYDKKTRTFDFFRPENFALGFVTCLSRDKQGHLIFGTINGGIIKYDPESKTFTNLVTPDKMMDLSGSMFQNTVFSILEDSRGYLWASIQNVGVARLEKTSGNLVLFNTSNGISVNKVRSITEDREGNIIFGTTGEGIEVFSSERFVAFSKKDGLVDNQVHAVCKDKLNRVWFGTNEGITIYDASAKKGSQYSNLTVENGLPNNNIRSLKCDKNGNMWIATWGGRVTKFDVAAGRITPVAALNDIVNTYAGTLLVDSKNKLWIGTNEGIVVYDLGNGHIKTLRTIDGMVSNDITAIFEDSKGLMWIGSTQKGLSLYDGKTFKTYNRENGLNYSAISSVAEDAKGRIWIGTEGGGVFVFDKGKFTNYKVADGLAADYISLLEKDKDNNMWLGTNRGLCKYISKEARFITFNAGNGYTGVETKPRAAYLDSDGNMWFGTVNGAYKYSPKLDLPVKVKPITKLLRFKASNTIYDLDEPINLGYKENSLEFAFVGISLANPQSLYYRVKLDGYDEEPKVLRNQDEIVYPNLQPGNYTFHLYSCNTSDVCSDELVYTITITPPYWKTWWFYLIIVTVIVSGLFTYIKVRERALQEEKRKLEAMVNERTAEVVEKNKELDEINKDITASIRYAKRIQDAILPPDEFVRQHLPNTFVLFKPKDIVSGDFYWMEERQEKIIFAAVDCTGHGVPGAFMSIVGHNVLDRVVGEGNITEPARILDELNRGISETLRQSNLEDNTVRDGMDIAMCAIDRKKGILEFAGAYNPLWLIRNGELTEIKANKFPIGNSRSGDMNKFTNHELQLQKGDTLYIFSDGYCDQFGGPAGKKFKASALRQILLANQHLSMEAQHVLLDASIEEWRGNHEQVDDILIIGTRY
jgi:ligand-binding sensor domain-containing protein/serine phosphatase RsbU (regulator of sigma subunit)